MIILRDKTTQNNIKFELTLFPDGTTQCWKVDETANWKNIELIWMFESQSEFMSVLQLITLLGVKEITIPFYPYARQDKNISNNTTFAKRTFDFTLSSFGITKIKTFDIHSNVGLIYTESIYPIKAFHKLSFNHDYICYPDAGAVERYSKLNSEKFIYANKERNQLTGEITNIKLNRPVRLEGSNVLIIDDLADGGGTFIPLVKKLKEYGVNNVDLCVSHGIFSKGINILLDAGINHIYTTNSLIKNNNLKHKNITVFNIVDLNVNLKINDRKMV